MHTFCPCDTCRTGKAEPCYGAVHVQHLPDVLQLVPGLAIGQVPEVQKSAAKSDAPLHKSAGMAGLIHARARIADSLETT